MAVTRVKEDSVSEIRPLTVEILDFKDLDVIGKNENLATQVGWYRSNQIANIFLLSIIRNNPRAKLA